MADLTRVRATVNLVGLRAGQEALVDVDDPDIRVHLDAQALVVIENLPAVAAEPEQTSEDEPVAEPVPGE